MVHGLVAVAPQEDHKVKHTRAVVRHALRLNTGTPAFKRGHSKKRTQKNAPFFRLISLRMMCSTNVDKELTLSPYHSPENRKIQLKLPISLRSTRKSMGFFPVSTTVSATALPEKTWILDAVSRFLGFSRKRVKIR